MSDTFAAYSPSLESPAANALAVTPSDATDLPNATRCLLVGAAGVVTVDMIGGGSAIALPLVAGYNPVRVTRVYATGTDNTLSIIALW